MIPKKQGDLVASLSAHMPIHVVGSTFWEPLITTFSAAIWPSRYVYNCLFWRQFHRYFPLNNPDDPRRVPPYEDRIYIDTWPDYYDPVSCSSSDLYCLDQLDCDPITRDGSIYDIPENWFGYQALPAPATEYNRKYAGIYYRLNGIVMGAGGLANEVATSNPATDYWREYLEV